MTRHVAALLSLALAAAACGPAAGPAIAPAASVRSPDPAGTLAPVASAPQSATPAPASSKPSAAPVGARIDLHEFAVDSAGGTWTSPWHEPGFAFSRVVPSWSAETPGGSFIRIRMQARTSAGEETSWYSFGVWAYDDDAVPRSSSDGQRDRFGRIDTDTLLATTPMAAYRLRVEPYRASASAPAPVVRSAFAVASDPATIPTSAPCAPGACPLAGGAKDLAVPAYSQEIHAGEHPEFDGGGEAWCSPTSTAMILAFWGKGPSAAEMSWVGAPHGDPAVDHAARYTYDASYGGTGNWSFNAAYAARFGMRSFVTQLRSLGEAERFIAAGIPLVASVKIAPGGLPGFLFAQGTNGHLLVIRGFTESGDVIANDPAATGDASVRRVYPRAPFERAWLGGSAGTVYVIHPPTTELPTRAAGMTPNW